MSDFILKRESCEELLDFNVLISTFENKAEQRRLKSSHPLIGFRIKSPALTKTQMKEYRDFFISKYGGLSEFTFTSPFDDIEYNVRFEPGSFKITYGGGIYNCEFDFKVLSEA